ncbi:hypothetical protein HUO13_07760 [Saccharopolyspora erythraea]|uniref:hypothetical protein n=1 Tax=Saccharopolyspora erythraea TaxID=1836 RepID=UPI001BAABD31|nr:hypothetical protein [Saccharopolyspora erythraea]QUH00722.1 hypothetical protein HUO13_07760 [Saccharopolyspora erythraea]
MKDDDVFGRRWVLTEDELLRMLWRCHAGENPDVVLVELHANHREPQPHPRHRGAFGGRLTSAARHAAHRYRRHHVAE